MKITGHREIPDNEIEITPIRSSGPGGQNVNKVSTAIHLRFDINASSLPEHLRQALMALPDRRISRDGVIVIKANRYRSQEKNREDALDRLDRLVGKAGDTRKPRKPTRPGRAARERRVDGKTHRGKIKALRRKIDT